MSLDDIKKLQKDRFAFLKKMWEVTEGDKMKWVNAFEIGNELGFNRDQTRVICDYLVDEYLLEWRGMGGTIGISHGGIKEMEEAITNPDDKTEHFLPMNVIMVGNMTNSSINQGNFNSTINTTITQNDISQIKDIIEKLDLIMNKITFESNQKEDLVASIDTVKAQCKAVTPKKDIIISALKTIVDILKITPTIISTELDIVHSLEAILKSLGVT